MTVLFTVLWALAVSRTPAQETRVTLKEGPGRAKAQVCVMCHSADYIIMNAGILDKAGWTASVNKMINAFGAPIAKEDVEPIATYLATYYGKSPAK
jgi:hypothetical protein